MNTIYIYIYIHSHKIVKVERDSNFKWKNGAWGPKRRMIGRVKELTSPLTMAPLAIEEKGRSIRGRDNRIEGRPPPWSG